jgi:hypothetical protein
MERIYNDIEGLNALTTKTESLEQSQNQLDYLQEIVPDDWDKISPADQAYTIDMIDTRISEITGNDMPKGLDSDKQIKEILSPILSELKPELLEAPHDHIQTERISDYIFKQESLDYENWKELPSNKRMEVLSSLEKQIANIEHRPECPIFAENLEEGRYGYFSPEEHKIVINKEYIDSSNKADYYEVLDTLIHEGRHAYQDYNMHEREVHPRQSEVDSWQENEDFGYASYEEMGLRAYRLQPLETDARQFAQDVVDKIKKEWEA